jgi:ABC-type transport system substrate-binding protein
MKVKSIFIATLLVMLTITVFAIPTPVLAQEEGLFELVIIAPGDANLLRRQWGLIVANSLKSVGIDASVVFLGWGPVIDRVFEPAEDVTGAIYADGGFDIQLIGWRPGNPALPFTGAFQTYYSTNRPPDSNYVLWNNSIADGYLDDALNLGYTDEGIEAFKNWQAVQFEEVPASMIHFSSIPFVASNDIDFNGWEWIYDNITPEPERITTSLTDVVSATTGDLKDLNPPISNSWYDTVVYAPVFDALFNINQTFQYPIDMSLCSDYISSDNGTWIEHTYILRDNVQFHDGEVMDADDVVFTFLGYLIPDTGSYFSGLTAGFMGDDFSFTWQNGTTTRLILNQTQGTSAYPAAPSEVSEGDMKVYIEAINATAVRVSGADIKATYHPSADVLFVLPKHILEPSSDAITAGPEINSWLDWDTHPFNTGTGGPYTVNGQDFYGPIGTGPYVCLGYNDATQLVTSEKFDDYWDLATLEAEGQFDVEMYYTRYIVEKDPAIAALKNDEVQILGGQYQMQRDYIAGNLDFASVYVLEAAGVQTVGYNMEHPVIGTGVDTPLGQEEPSRAAEAAKYVRQAMDYLIPRDLIITNLLSGLGDPGHVHVNPLSPYFNTTITARPYDPAKAAELLAMAGYDTGVTPEEPTAGDAIMLGQPVTVTGTFTFDTVAGIEQGGIVVVLEESTDNETWTPIAQGITTTGGYYSLSYLPTATGDYYYRVYLTGAGAETAALSGASGPDFPYDGLSPSVDTQTSLATQVTVQSFDTAVTDAVADATSDLSTQVSDQSTQISDLSAQISQQSTIAYAGIAAGIIGIIIALFYKKQ